MQELYIPLDIKYDPLIILDKLYENPHRRQRACSLDEISFIKSHLELEYPIVSILNFPLQIGSVSNIHKDEILGHPETNPGFALNLPLYRTEKTYMKWYIAKANAVDGLFYGGPTAGTPTPKLLTEDSECIETLLLNSPHLINVTGWHSIENNLPDAVSQIISIRFSRNISYKDIINFSQKKSATEH